MNQRDEFSKWMSAVEEAMEVTNPSMMAPAPAANKCGCCNWNCAACFPSELDMDQPQDAVVVGGRDMDGELELVGDTGSFSLRDDIEDPDMVGADLDEEENTFVEKPRSGKGVKLGNIVQSTKVVPTGGQNSPLSMGGDNLDEGNWYEPEMDDLEFDDDDYSDIGHYEPGQHNMADYDQAAAFGTPSDADIEEMESMASAIKGMQDAGFSKASVQFDEMDFQNATPQSMKQMYDAVMNGLSEAPKPTKTKTQHDFDFDDTDILGNQNPIANVDQPAGFDDEPDDQVPGGPSGIDSLRRSSSANTRNKVGAITPSDTMRDLMNRMNPDAGADEPERPEQPMDALTVRTATDVPAVVNNALRAAGVENPEWHSVNDLPGMGNRNIRGVGRNVFSAFTSTPQEQILTLANVNGQGPSTDAELRAVGGWLKNYAEDMGPVTVDFGTAIPGYKPDVREFRANGVRFHVVRDPAGQYIYAYPDQDARSHGAQQGALPGAQQGGMPQRGNTPRLREMVPTLFEQMKWDEELKAVDGLFEEVITESTLSRLLGKEKGGQNLVQWLHKKHKLSNEAELEPTKFSKQLLWSQFKSNPDDFVIISAENGVAGIKPSSEYMAYMRKKKADKGEDYNPGGDGTLQYNVVAFTDDGRQIDPKLFQQDDKPEKTTKKGDSDKFISRDPTVIKARMGLQSGRDTQNPDNIFNLLVDQLGPLRTVWVSGFGGYRGDPASLKDPKGSVERDKMAKRTDLKKPGDDANIKLKFPDRKTPVKPSAGNDAAPMEKIFNRVRPVLKKLGDQAYSQITRMAQRSINGGNFDAGQKMMQNGQKLKDFMITLDSPNAINLDTGWGNPSRLFGRAIIQALETASGSKSGTDEYEQWLDAAARGNAVALQPVLDGLRKTLVSLSGINQY